MNNLADIVNKVKHGDEKAFRALYDFYAGRLHGFALRVVKSPDLADDVVQDVFVRIWELRESLDATKQFQSFLFTVARNRMINLLKRSATDASVLGEIFKYALHSSNFTEEQIDFNESNELLHQALELLPPQQKRIFELCKINGFTYEEAARELNLSPGTINVQIVKSMKIVKAYFHLHKGLTVAMAGYLAWF